MYFDAHTHLNEDRFYPQWQSYVQRFVDVGGKWLINVWVDMEWNRRAVDIAQHSLVHFPDILVKATAWYHPSEVCFQKIWDIDTAMLVLHDFCPANKDHIIAIGECWIDAHYPGDKRLDEQKKLFTTQCELARELWLPVVIHSRDDFASTWDVIQHFKDLNIYFHCRGYGPEELQFLVKELPQVWFWFDGNITYPKAENLRQSLYVCPVDRILLETDAPYLTPQVKRGQDNEPANIGLIYEYVATILHKDVSLLSDTIRKNFIDVFSVPL